MTMYIKVVLIAVSLLSSSHTEALTCTQTANPVSYKASPSLYHGVVAISSGVDGCDVFEASTELQCDYSVVLGDGVMVPSPPDLTNSTYLRHFLAWEGSSLKSYVDFDLNGLVVTAIELSFLNSPANRISLPDIQLSIVTAYGSTFEDDTTVTIQRTMVDNQDLAQTDNHVRSVTLLAMVGPHLTIRIGFEFTEFHDFDWFLLSEVRFCTDPQPAFQPSVITFQQPTTSIVEPTADDLIRGSTELECTASNEGEYQWQWEKDNTVIVNDFFNYEILIGDGSRTTKLVILNLDFNDAGQYKCIATTQASNDMASLVFTIQYPEVVTTPGAMIVLPCKLHGYQSSLSSPVWLFMNGTEITTSDKYTITSGARATDIIVLENGTTFPSLFTNLTIHDLSSADAVEYICRGPRGSESVTQITVVEGTAPITISPGEGSCQDSNAATTAVLAIPLLAMTTAMISLLVIVIFLLKKVKTLSAMLKYMEAPIPVAQNEVLSNIAYQSETNSIDTEGYEVVPEHLGTTLSRNKAYNKRRSWLPSHLIRVFSGQSSSHQATERTQPSEYVSPISAADASVRDTGDQVSVTVGLETQQEEQLRAFNQLQDYRTSGGHTSPAISEGSDQSDYDDVTVIPQLSAHRGSGDNEPSAAESTKTDGSDYENVSIVPKYPAGSSHQSQLDGYSTGSADVGLAAASLNRQQPEVIAREEQESVPEQYSTRNPASRKSNKSEFLVVANPAVTGTPGKNL